MDEKYLKDFRSLNKELSVLNQKMLDIDREVASNFSDFNELQKEIDTKKLCIEEEKTLQNYPPGAQGSVFFHNVMTNKYDLFDINHLNKITRFFSFIEKLEDQYSSLYLKATVIYYKDPRDKSISELYATYMKLLDSYKLLFVLIVEVDRDKLLYHQVFNKLEDSGIFLTLNEKLMIDTLIEISEKLTDVIKAIHVQISVSNETNNLFLESIDALKGLRSDIDFVSSDISNLGFELSDMQSEIWGLSQNKND